MLTLFYITNNPDVALIAEKYGIDRVWIDLETLGKSKRQGGMDTVKSHHTIEDISRIKPLLSRSQLMARVNPWNENSVAEIDRVISAGADVVMLPMWRSAEEVGHFLDAVNGRAITSLLLETKDGVECIDEVLKLDFDEIHIGLNDLHLSYGMTFMFELLVDGTVERLCRKFKTKGIPYGFGGIARLGGGLLPAEKVIMEHYRLGSTRAILSRSFCNVDECNDLTEIEDIFKNNMHTLREFEATCSATDFNAFHSNRVEVSDCVEHIVKILKEKAE